MKNYWKNLSFTFVAVLAGSLTTGVVMSLPQQFKGNALAQEGGQTTPRVNQQSLEHAQGLSAAFRNVAEALRPSVVRVSTRIKAAAPGRRPLPPGVPPSFQDLFDGYGGRPRGEQSGMGSGVIVRPDGYILTNNHVVEGADELIVELADGRKAAGKIVGTDPQTDLAVVKIDLPGLRAAPFGSSDDIQVGDWVLAIGSPFGLDQTVTAGIISGKNRVQQIIDDGRGFEDFLQTDAAINPGNSGGPLVNLYGELVGINTAILSRTGNSAGIGFAIPVALAQPVLQSIIENGEVRRGFLGAAVDDVTPETVKRFNLAVKSGALVGGVLENQAAAKAGLQPGDVVTQLDGRAVISGRQLRNYVASRPPGSTVKMDVNRAGKTMQIQVNLQERTKEAMAMFSETGGLFGAEMIPATPEAAREYGYQGLQSGLIVTQVEDGSAAAQADLQVGDVIESAAGTPLKSVKQLADIFEASKKSGQPLRCVVRRGSKRFLLVIR